MGKAKLKETVTASASADLDCYRGRTVLVTGGLGFIGSALVDALTSLDCRILLLVRPGRIVNSGPPGVAEQNIIRGDMQHRETWMRAMDGVDYVFHLAGQKDVYLANEDPLGDLNANLVPVLHMLEVCRAQGFHPRFLFSGTVTQVGITTKLPVDETFQDLPTTIYGIHKLTAEKYLQYYAQEAGITTVTLRLANVYGSGPDVNSRDRGVFNRMIRRALEGETLTVYGAGTWIRDFVFIDDVVQAFLAAGSAADKLLGNYYLIGSGVGTRFVDAITMVADQAEVTTGRRPPVEHVDPPRPLLAIDNRDFVANISRFRRATGWAPRVTLAEGIARTMDFFTNRQGIEKPVV